MRRLLVIDWELPDTIAEETVMRAAQIGLDEAAARLQPRKAWLVHGDSSIGQVVSLLDRLPHDPIGPPGR